MSEKKPNILDEITLELEELDVFDSDIDPELEKKLFEDLGAVDGFQEYLTMLLANDIKQYFGAQPGGQLMIKGAFNRTRFLKSKLRNRDKEVKEKKNMKSKRHL